MHVLLLSNTSYHARTNTPSKVPGEAARTALLIALGAIRSVETGATINLAESIEV